MKNKLSQEYKDDLYEKVLEKKRQRCLKRKKMLSICIIFISVVGFTTLGFSLLGQDDYNNFFTSESENILIEDEYQYFDDLGIKLEFINIDNNSLTLGINIKYDNIADYKFGMLDFNLIDKDINDVIVSDFIGKSEKTKMKLIKEDKVYNSNSELRYIIKFEFCDKVDFTKIELEVNKIKLVERKNDNNVIMKEFEYKKEISIEE